MSAFQHIATTLAGRSNPWAAPRKAEPQPKGMTKTDKIRHYLRTQGPANCHTLAMEAEVVSTSLVGSLLAGDIEKGRILFRAGMYHWNQQYDEALQKKLAAAAALLKRHGWTVSKP